MKSFMAITTSVNAKKKHFSNASFVYSDSLGTNKPNQESYQYLEELNFQDLDNLNANSKKKNIDLIHLWSILEMEKYIDFKIGSTINYYISAKLPILKLADYNYLIDYARIQNLLDIKYIKKFELDNILFSNIYFVIYEILDPTLNVFRPYIEVFHKNELNNFIKIGYGYDSTNNKIVDLFIANFNYGLFLDTSGIITIPLTDKKIKLKIYDELDDADIGKINPNPGENFSVV